MKNQTYFPFIKLFLFATQYLTNIRGRATSSDGRFGMLSEFLIYFGVALRMRFLHYQDDSHRSGKAKNGFFASSGMTALGAR